MAGDGEATGLSAGGLGRAVLTRFFPAVALLVVVPVVAAQGSLRTVVWWVLGFQAVGISLGFGGALLPLRDRLDPAVVASLRWHVVSAAFGVLATGVFLLFPDRARLGTILGVTVSGGLIGALPMLVAAWTGPRRGDEEGDQVDDNRGRR